MEIIKDGQTRKIRFVCFECACVYDADLGKDAKVTKHTNNGCELVEYSCNCPKCNFLNYKTINKRRPEEYLEAIGPYGRIVEL